MRALHKRSPIDRYREKIDVIRNGCWLAKKPGATGYGSLTLDGKEVALHRASWLLHKGEIPDGLCVLHKCDVRACSNPDHLYLGTKKQNRADFMERHPEAKELIEKSKAARVAGLREFWRSMSDEERREFCERRADTQRRKRSACAGI